jgi:hypothetical protein
MKSCLLPYLLPSFQQIEPRCPLLSRLNPAHISLIEWFQVQYSMDGLHSVTWNGILSDDQVILIA